MNLKELRELAQINPQQFEQERQKLIDTFIQNASPDSQRRLKGIQFQLDMTRQLGKNPQDSYAKIYHYICKIFHNDFHPNLDRLERKLLAREKIVKEDCNLSRIMPFSSKSED